MCSFACDAALFIFRMHPREHIAKRYWDAHKSANIMCRHLHRAGTTESLKSHIRDAENAG